MFDIRWQEQVLMIRLGGFWDETEFAAYDDALSDVLQQASGQGFLMLADLSGMTTQTAEIVERHGMATDQIIAAGARAIAVVTPSALLRRQVDRAIQGSIPSATFDDVSAARGWLESQSTPGGRTSL